jgi:TonB family protein
MRIWLQFEVVILGMCIASGHVARSESPSIGDIPNTPALNTTRIAPDVMAGRILTHTVPVYPKDAKKKHISGIVVLHAIIGKDGKIQNLTALSGPIELQGSALDAVKQWAYLPYELNGQPVVVETTITVTYSMGEQATLRHNGTMITNREEAVELAANARELRKVKKVSPIYPLEAKQKSISGDVIVSVWIGLDGHVESVDVISGPDLLRDAATDAVRQWVYPPFAVKGVAKRVHTVATVEFRLS